VIEGVKKIRHLEQIEGDPVGLARLRALRDDVGKPGNAFIRRTFLGEGEDGQGGCAASGSRGPPPREDAADAGVHVLDVIHGILRDWVFASVRSK